MVELPKYPPLKSLHPDSSLNAAKLAKMERLSTETLLASLVPGLKDCLKARTDGTILDGHHRLHILRQRGVDVDGLPRDVVVKNQDRD
jgi:ParB-like chromosome segregation protein Spo0J